jgi:superfamily I DNA/RNA helicase
MLFLAPQQKQLIIRPFKGPTRIKGVASSGKTVVAIHHARHLARRVQREGRKVLFLTYGSRLPNVLRYLLEHLAGGEAPELEAIECCTVHQWCYGFLSRHGKRPVQELSQYPGDPARRLHHDERPAPGRHGRGRG